MTARDAVCGVRPYLSVLHLIDNSLECCRVVHGEVGEHLAVDLDTGLVNQAHKL